QHRESQSRARLPSANRFRPSDPRNDSLVQGKRLESPQIPKPRRVEPPRNENDGGNYGTAGQTRSRSGRADVSRDGGLVSRIPPSRGRLQGNAGWPGRGADLSQQARLPGEKR